MRAESREEMEVDLDYLDLDKERTGVRVDHPKGFWVQVRAWQSPYIQEKLALRVTARLGELKKTQLSAQEYEECERWVRAEEVLTGWGNLKAGPWSKELAHKLIEDPRLRYFDAFVNVASREVNFFMAEGVEAIAKN